MDVINRTLSVMNGCTKLHSTLLPDYVMLTKTSLLILWPLSKPRVLNSVISRSLIYPGRRRCKRVTSESVEDDTLVALVTVLLYRKYNSLLNYPFITVRATLHTLELYFEMNICTETSQECLRTSTSLLMLKHVELC